MAVGVACGFFDVRCGGRVLADSDFITKIMFQALVYHSEWYSLVTSTNTGKTTSLIGPQSLVVIGQI